LLKVAHRALNERQERHGDLNKDILAHDDVASNDLVVILLHSRFSGVFFDTVSHLLVLVILNRLKRMLDESRHRVTHDSGKNGEKFAPSRDLGQCHQPVHDKVASHYLDAMLLHSWFGGLLFEKVGCCYYHWTKGRGCEAEFSSGFTRFEKEKHAPQRELGQGLDRCKLLIMILFRLSVQSHV
jgi:hypothetical protein